MPWSEEKRETGSALMIIGWVLVLFAFLVMFFQPAAFKLGESRFQIIAGILVAAGLALNIIGARIRSRNT
jgi:NADH:ubiquinone oxidoreductase subunit 6 (subunit J)